MGKSLSIIVIIVILSIGFAHVVVAQSIGYGLEFNSFEVAQEKRTSLDLSPSETLSFPYGFSLSFDMYYQTIIPQHNFGYVFRLIGRNERYIDFLMNIYRLTVVNSEGEVLANCLMEEITKDEQLFFPFSMLLDIKNNRLDISIGGVEYSPQISNIGDFKKVNIIFGRCNYSHLQASDVPKMTIRNIRINNAKGKTLYYWPLSRHTDDGVYDELKRSFAKIENPKWLIDTHAYWKKRSIFSTMKNPQIAFNPNSKQILVADMKNFYVYDTYAQTLIKNEPSSGLILSSFANQMVYNHQDGLYYSYSLDHLYSGKSIAVFDTIAKGWANSKAEDISVDFWHHNRLISDYDSCLYTFGGYGHHSYKNLINQYSFKTKTWNERHYKGDTIQPRYLSGLGMIDKYRALIFGGHGSEAAVQELSPHNYYDLHLVDLRDMTAKKIWEMEPQKNGFVVANSLIVDTLNKCFYALCFPHQLTHTSLFLARFSMEKPGFETVSDSIPYLFRDITSYADLFLNKETNEISAVTYSSETADAAATVSIYTLSYPPIAESAIYQDSGGNSNRLKIFSALIILSVCIAVGIGMVIKKKKGDNDRQTELSELQEIKNPGATHTQLVAKTVQKRAVLLFGGFQVRDKDGKDVTGEFTPLLKQLFLIIFLNTLKEDSKGVSSVKLKDTLWYDKSGESARNNRSVMLSKLRQIFEQVGDLSIERHNVYWTLRLGEEIYCDYKEALELMLQLKHKINISKENILRFIRIVSGGELLPNIQIEWIDPFKADFANNLIDTLLEINYRKELNLSLQESINIADAILKHDILNEDALKLKCSALTKMGKNGLAKAIYNRFVKEYSVLFGTAYKNSFEQIIS
jgi:two-component SAPR family response regulator